MRSIFRFFMEPWPCLTGIDCHQNCYKLMNHFNCLPTDPPTTVLSWAWIFYDKSWRDPPDLDPRVPWPSQCIRPLFHNTWRLVCPLKSWKSIPWSNNWPQDLHDIVNWTKSWPNKLFLQSCEPAPSILKKSQNLGIIFCRTLYTDCSKALFCSYLLLQSHVRSPCLTQPICHCVI